MASIRIILHGKAAGDSRVRTAVRVLREEGLGVAVRVTWEQGDAARFTAEAVAAAQAAEIDRIVAGGGDGTVNEVFAAAYTAGLPDTCTLGVLPLGTANDFAHAVGLPVQDITAALRIAATAPPRRMDLGLVNGKPFVNLVSGGFGSRVTAETDPRLKRHLGQFAYAITGLSRFAELTANYGRFAAEDFSWEGQFLALAIGNGRMAGGGVMLCPAALLDDGLLDLAILPALDSSARLPAVVRLLSEGADALRTLIPTARSSWIEFESADELNINLDGEPILTKKFRVECRRRVLPVRLGGSALLS